MAPGKARMSINWTPFSATGFISGVIVTPSHPEGKAPTSRFLVAS